MNPYYKTYYIEESLIISDLASKDVIEFEQELQSLIISLAAEYKARASGILGLREVKNAQ